MKLTPPNQLAKAIQAAAGNCVGPMSLAWDRACSGLVEDGHFSSLGRVHFSSIKKCCSQTQGAAGAGRRQVVPMFCRHSPCPLLCASGSDVASFGFASSSPLAEEPTVVTGPDEPSPRAPRPYRSPFPEGEAWLCPEGCGSRGCESFNVSVLCLKLCRVSGSPSMCSGRNRAIVLLQQRRSISGKT